MIFVRYDTMMQLYLKEHKATRRWQDAKQYTKLGLAKHNAPKGVVIHEFNKGHFVKSHPVEDNREIVV